MRLLLPLLSLAVAAPLPAQEFAAYFSARLQPSERAPFSAPAGSGPRNSGRLVLGGLLGATAGFGVAMLAYTALDRQDPCLASDCDSRLGAGLAAATVGLTLAIPLGVHLADSRRGSFLKDLVVSAAIAGVGWGGAALADDARWLLLVPPGQIVGAVLAERGSARERARAR